jgi:hypothetical protein
LVAREKEKAGGNDSRFVCLTNKCAFVQIAKAIGFLIFVDMKNGAGTVSAYGGTGSA